MDELYVESPDCIPSYHTLPINPQPDEVIEHETDEIAAGHVTTGTSPVQQQAREQEALEIPQFKPPSYLAHISHSLPPQLQTVYLPPTAFLHHQEDPGEEGCFDSTTLFSPLLRQELDNSVNSRNRSTSLPTRARRDECLDHHDETSSDSEQEDEEEGEHDRNRRIKRKRDRLPSYKSGSNETVILNQSGQIVAVEPVPSRRGRILRQSRSGRPLLGSDRSRSRYSPSRSPVPNRCLYAHDGRHDLVDEFSLAGIMAAVLCFPVGIVCCFAWCRTERCVNCGHVNE